MMLARMCLGKGDDYVEITTLGSAYRMYLCIPCGGLRYVHYDKECP